MGKHRIFRDLVGKEVHPCRLCTGTLTAPFPCDSMEYCNLDFHKGNDMLKKHGYEPHPEVEECRGACMTKKEMQDSDCEPYQRLGYCIMQKGDK